MSAVPAGEVIALDLSHQDISADNKNVKELWRAQLSSEILSRPVIAQGVLVVKTIDGRVYGLNVEDGSEGRVGGHADGGDVGPAVEQVLHGVNDGRCASAVE